MVRASSPTQPGGKDALADWIATRTQAMLDVAATGAAAISMLRVEQPEQGTRLTHRLELEAFEQGFAVARVDLGEGRALASLDVVTRAILHGIRTSPRGKPGLSGVLDGLVHRHGQRAIESLPVNAAAGPLSALARAHVQSRLDARIGVLDAWIDGVDLSRAVADVPPPLGLGSAMRTLFELTRIMRALGCAGTWITFANADALTRLPVAARQTAYGVLRELFDNADAGRGMEATCAVLVGSAKLFEGPRSIQSHAPLAMRAASFDGIEGPAPPHRPLLDLPSSQPHRAPSSPGPRDLAGLSAIVRASRGLPSNVAIRALSVGMQAIDSTIDRMFATTRLDGSVFALLVGEYGAGKTHLLMHLAERALQEHRPVLRLSIERLDADLGSPQRHLSRMLEQGTLARTSRPSPIDRLVAWTADRKAIERLVGVLGDIATSNEAASAAATRILAKVRRADNRGRGLRALLLGTDLETKPSHPTYRLDAYGRLLLWVALLERLEGASDPVVIIDEGENLFRFSRTDRRTALRSLAFYCGGAIPRACVALALTPSALDQLRAECDDLLGEVAEQKTALAWEDAEMLRRRLSRTRPIEVPAFEPRMLRQLASQLRAVHAEVRGPVIDPGWPAAVERACNQARSPREMMRICVDRLERTWWYGAGS